MTDAVRKALAAARDAAAEKWPAFDVRFADECSRDDGEVAACDAFVTAINTFLRALPDLNLCQRSVCKFNGSAFGNATDLAAAVEAAAKGDA